MEALQSAVNLGALLPPVDQWESVNQKRAGMKVASGFGGEI